MPLRQWTRLAGAHLTWQCLHIADTHERAAVVATLEVQRRFDAVLAANRAEARFGRVDGIDCLSQKPFR